MSNYSENDWRYYSEAELEHSWGDSPEQKAAEREYNHRYWLENRDRIIRQRAARAAGRDFESEMRNLDQRAQALEQDRQHDQWNARQHEERWQGITNRANQIGDRFNERARTHEYWTDYENDTMLADAAYATGQEARRRQQNVHRESVESSSRNLMQQHELQSQRRQIQREYDAAVKAYQNTPVARLENAAATAVEAGRQAVRAALDAVSSVAYSVVSRFKKK